MAVADEGALEGFGARVRQARQALPGSRGRRVLSQGELADRVGVGVNTISAIENGRRPRDPELIVRLANELGVTSAWLLGEQGAGVSGPALSAGERAELPPAVAKAARAMVDAFKREAALAGATPADLHYIETVLMTPNLPPTLFGGRVPAEKFLQHIQAMMEPLRNAMRDAGLHL